MTTQEIIEKIRAEVERQRKEIRPTDTREMKVVGTPTQLEQGWLNALSWMEKVLDTLQEQPVCEGLEDEIARMWAKSCHLNEKKDQRIATLTSIEFEELARHFARWGAEHLKK